MKKNASIRSAPAYGQPVSQRAPLDSLLGIMARLRGEAGCPWDREQTEKTLKRFLLEEAYEVLEAIERGKPDSLKEELGDLLLQIVFLSQIAAEKGRFSFADVVRGLVGKLIRRHPHIFPSADISVPVAPRSGREVRKIWREVKKREAQGGPPKSLLEGLPVGLPALIRTQRMSDRAARVGFDWPRVGGVWAKVREEMRELKRAERDKAAREREFGDVLFSLVNLARHYGFSAEEALRKANRRFAERFRRMEKEFDRKGLSPEEVSLREMDREWKRAKKEKNGR